jgi:hypothetical protein
MKKLESGSRATKIGFLFISMLMLLPSLTLALSLREALDEAAIYFTKTAVKIDPSKKMVIQVVNYHSQKQDTDARKIETELYFALERQFPNYKLVLLSEALAGVSDRDAVFVKGTYEKQGKKTIVRLQAVKGSLTGIILAQTMVAFESKKMVQKTLVAVMDIEAGDLKPIQRKAYSEIFRSALIQIGAFDLASSADIDKLNPDAVQKATGCTRDECATIIGEQLGVDRSISTVMLKLGERNYLLSSKILDIKDGSIVTSKTLEHKGGLDTIKKSLEDLALALGAKKKRTDYQGDDIQRKRVEKKAKLVIKVSPDNANVFLNDESIKMGLFWAVKSEYFSENDIEYKAYSVEIPFGKYKIDVKLQNYETISKEILVDEEKAYSDQTVLKPTEEYVAQLEYEKNMELYNEEMSSFRWKFWGTLALSTAFAGYSYTEFLSAEENFIKQEEEKDAVSASVSYEEASTHSTLAKQYNTALNESNQNMQIGAAGSIILFSIATWIWFDEPEEPKKPKILEESTWRLFHHKDNTIELAYQVRF